MTCEEVWWKEIGCARRFADSVADAMRCGKSALLQAAEDIPWKDAFKASVEERLSELSFFDMDINNEGYSVQTLQEYLVREHTKERGEGYRDSFYEYFSERHIEKRGYRLHNIPAGDAKKWQEFFARYAKESKRHRLPPLLIEFPVQAPRGLPERLAVFSWREALNRYDFRLFASRIADKEELSDVKRDYLAAFAALLAGTDAELCAEIAEEYGEFVFANRYKDLLSALSERYATDPRHALTLYGEEKTGEIERIIWEAQLTTFFPRIETWRARLLDHYRDFLAQKVLPAGKITDPYSHKPIVEVDELELTVLFHQIAGKYEYGRELVFSAENSELELMYRARNELAHLRILPAESLRRLLELFGQDTGKHGEQLASHPHKYGIFV